MYKYSSPYLQSICYFFFSFLCYLSEGLDIQSDFESCADILT
jgi:hypothetical protein